MAQIIVSKLPDATVIAMMEAIEQSFAGQNLSFRVADLDVAKAPEKLRNSNDTYAISRSYITGVNGQFTVEFTRNFDKSPYFDVVDLKSNNSANPRPTPDIILSVDALISSYVAVPDYTPAIAENSPVFGILQKELASIASMHRSLIGEALSLRTKQEEQALERQKTLEQAEEQSRARIAELELESHQRIEKEKGELDEKLKEFDISDHMRARRRLRDDITAEVRGSLAKPVATRQAQMKFLQVTAFCLVAIVGAGFFAYESFQAFVSAAALPAPSLTTESETAAIVSQPNTYLLWMLAIRGILLSAVAIGFAYYLVSMLRTSYDEDIRTLRELQRYGMDINRASWIIETAMEMQTKENASLPNAWIEGACNGLFQTSPDKGKEVNSLSALGAVLGLGPEVSVGPEGASFKIPPKAAKKAANDAT